MCKKWFFVALLFVAPAWAQGIRAFVVGGPAAGLNEGGHGSFFGLGAEYMSTRGIGAAGEIAGIGVEGERLYLPSVNVVFESKTRKADIFFTAGYTRASTNCCGANGLNFGAGVSYWFHRRMAIRLEPRFYVIQPSEPLYVFAMRFGFVFGRRGE